MCFGFWGKTKKSQSFRFERTWVGLLWPIVQKDRPPQRERPRVQEATPFRGFDGLGPRLGPGSLLATGSQPGVQMESLGTASKFPSVNTSQQNGEVCCFCGSTLRGLSKPQFQGLASIKGLILQGQRARRSAFCVCREATVPTEPMQTLP